MCCDPDCPMTEHNTEWVELKDRLRKLEDGVSKIQTALLGEFPHGGGLLTECRLRATQAAAIEARVAALERRFEDAVTTLEQLKIYRKQLIAWGAGICFATSVAWAIITHFMK